jgi:hypothetical protein
VALQNELQRLCLQAASLLIVQQVRVNSGLESCSLKQPLLLLVTPKAVAGTAFVN